MDADFTAQSKAQPRGNFQRDEREAPKVDPRRIVDSPAGSRIACARRRAGEQRLGLTKGVRGSRCAHLDYLSAGRPRRADPGGWGLRLQQSLLRQPLGPSRSLAILRTGASQAHSGMSRRGCELCRSNLPAAASDQQQRYRERRRAASLRQQSAQSCRLSAHGSQSPIRSRAHGSVASPSGSASEFESFKALPLSTGKPHSSNSLWGRSSGARPAGCPWSAWQRAVQPSPFLGRQLRHARAARALR